jgi:hypothetical protein
MTSPVEHICYAYHAMAEEVTLALQTQVGDPTQLTAQRDRVLHLMAVADQVSATNNLPRMRHSNIELVYSTEMAFHQMNTQRFDLP